jgi:cytochrome c-type biogenesis protein CcmF
VGIVLIFVGFAGNGFEREVTLEMHPNDTVQLAPYEVKYHGLSVTQDAQKQMITADLEAFRDGKSLGRFYPARWFWAGGFEPTTEVALRRSPADDLYLVLAGYDAATQTATMHMKVNPLVNWIWFGVGVMVIGTGIAFLPERAIAFATRAVPEGAATTSLLLVLLLFGATRSALAQTDEKTPPLRQTTALGRQVEDELMCLCGCGAQLGNCPMAPNCSHWHEEQTFLTESVSNGMTHDQIIQAFVQRYGSQQVLAAPIDKGFNRLLWIVPYAAGAASVVVVGGIALRWARRREAQPVVTEHANANPALQERLDDELRELD